MKCLMAKRCGFKTVDVHFGTFDFTVHVIVGPGKHVLRYVQWKLNDIAFQWDFDNQQGMCFQKRGWVPIVWIPKEPRTPREFGALSHEMLHAVRHMLQDWAGLNHTYDTDEAWCHALGYAMTTTLEA